MYEWYACLVPYLGCGLDLSPVLRRHRLQHLGVAVLQPVRTSCHVGERKHTHGEKKETKGKTVCTKNQNKQQNAASYENKSKERRQKTSWWYMICTCGYGRAKGIKEMLCLRGFKHVSTPRERESAVQIVVTAANNISFNMDDVQYNNNMENKPEGEEVGWPL